MRDTKTCTKCGKEKPATAEYFYRDKGNKDGLTYYCKICVKAYNISVRGRRIIRSNHLRRKYKMDIDEYDRMLNEQNELCYICGKPETKINNKSGLVQPLSVDHDHETGEVRKLLCDRCNFILGKSEENIELLEKIIKYIKKYQNDYL